MMFTALSSLMVVAPMAATRLRGEELAPLTLSFSSLMLRVVFVPVTILLLGGVVLLALRLHKRAEIRRHLLAWIALLAAGSAASVWSPYPALTLAGPFVLGVALLLPLHWAWGLRDVWTRFTGWLRRAGRR